MIVINNTEGSYPEETLRHCNWERFEDKAIDCVLFNAGPWGPSGNIEDEWDIPKILLWFEEQTWDLDTTDNTVPYVDKILTILNPKISGRTNKRQSVFYPTNEEIVANLEFEKKYDVIYTGNANRGPHVDIIVDAIKDFNYKWISFEWHPLVTTSGLSYFEKLQLIANSKIDVCHGLVGNSTPQTKSRYFEAAFCKSLNLMYRDPWNAIEEWFVPGQDFLYWENKEELQFLISDVCLNYDKYLPIVENAYNKAITEYTTYRFVEKYIGFKDS
jgi:hypothetical protein